MNNLKGKVALVTGATRGVGKGIALALANSGAIVYFTGRTAMEVDNTNCNGGSLELTEATIREAGGIGYGIRCDHEQEDDTKAVMEQIISKQGRIDILVNNVWGGYEYFSDGTEFWKEKGFWDAPIKRFDKMFQAGVRAHYLTSLYAVPHMIEQGGGLIANISYWAAERNDMGVAYGMAKAATNKMTATMAHELKEYGIGVVTIYPGLVRTEGVLKSDYFDLSNSESPEFIGLAVAALATDENIMEKSGLKYTAAQLALDYGYCDIDGKQPIPLTESNVL